MRNIVPFFKNNDTKITFKQLKLKDLMTYLGLPSQVNREDQKTKLKNYAKKPKLSANH